MKTVAELRKENETLIAENGQMRQQLSQAAQMLQNNELASRQFELERVKALITMYTSSNPMALGEKADSLMLEDQRLPKCRGCGLCEHYLTQEDFELRQQGCDAWRRQNPVH